MELGRNSNGELCYLLSVSVSFDWLLDITITVIQICRVKQGLNNRMKYFATYISLISQYVPRLLIESVSYWQGGKISFRSAGALKSFRFVHLKILKMKAQKGFFLFRSVITYKRTTKYD